MPHDGSARIEERYQLLRASYLAEADDLLADLANVVGCLEPTDAAQVLGRMVGVIQSALPPEMARLMDSRLTALADVAAAWPGDAPIDHYPPDVGGPLARQEWQHEDNTATETTFTLDGATGGPLGGYTPTGTGERPPDDLVAPEAPIPAPEDGVPPAPVVPDHDLPDPTVSRYLAGVEQAQPPHAQARKARARTRKAAAGG